MAVTHAGNTTEEFETIVTNWIASAKHPKSGRPYTEMVFQPMLELLAYLRANGFKTFIVSGGGVEFMRPWTERVYGIPPEQVVGSRAKVKYEVRNGVPVLARLAEIDLVDDKAGQARRHPPGHRPPPDRRVRQLRRRLRDARVDDERGGAAAGGDRPPHRRGARMGLRPDVARRSARARPGRSPETRLGGRRHEAGLEGHLPVPETVTVPLHSVEPDTGATLNPSTYASNLASRSLPKRRMPERSVSPDTAAALIRDELLLDGNSRQNLATFCTTWV